MKLLILFFILVGLTSCSSSSSNIKRVDSKALCLTTIHWDSEALNEMAQKMVVSILKSKYLSTKPKKIYSFLKLKNRTYDHIDTEAITDSIKTGLLKSGRAIVVDIKKRDILHSQLDYQKNNQKYFAYIKKIGKELGVDAIFYGDISAIYQKNSMTKDMRYAFVLNLVDVQSGELVWSDEVEIRKLSKRALIGW